MILNHLKRLDWPLLGAIALVFVMGLAIFYADPGDHRLFWRQLALGAAGLVLVACLSFFDWRILKENSFVVIGLYVAGILLLFVLLVVGREVRGVISWFKLGAFNFEPVELVKIILAVVLAKYFSTRYIELYRWKNIIISALYTLAPVALVLVQPDLGSAVILLLIWFGLVLVSGIKVKQFFLITVLALATLVLLWSYGLKDYQKDRVVSFIYPERDPLGGAYQSQQAIIAVGSGGFWGKGLGGGTQTRLGFLPEHQTDFIFAAIAEEWGISGVLIFLSAWLAIFWRLYQTLLAAPDNFSRLFVTGFIIILASHFIINIGANLGFLPITGLPLPFVSYGGSNLISLALGLGLVQAIRIRVFRYNLGPEESD
ncbi:MAG: rod shape-determining protein RodA [Parcubacteria group bacterium]|nr:rod shape-determining protein RodA [Parcubacteria group bacterium]